MAMVLNEGRKHLVEKEAAAAGGGSGSIMER